MLCALELALHLGGGFYALRADSGGVPGWQVACVGRDRASRRTANVPEGEGFPDYGAMRNRFAGPPFSKSLNFNDQAFDRGVAHILLT